MLANLFRSRIQIGSFSPLQSFQTTCLGCHEDFNILWPIDTLSVSRSQAVDLIRPYCEHELLVVALGNTGTDGMFPEVYKRHNEKVRKRPVCPKVSCEEVHHFIRVVVRQLPP
jgi:hypothetical protein